APQPRECFAQYAALEIDGQGAEPFAVKNKRAVFGARHAVKDANDILIDVGVIVGEGARAVTHNLAEIGIDFFEIGNDLQTEAIAKDGGIKIGLVNARLHVVLDTVRFNFRAGNIEEGTDELEGSANIICPQERLVLHPA